MINDLLDLSKIEAGTMQLNSKTLVIADLAESIVDNLHMLASDKQLSLQATIADKRLVVRGDPDKLTQVLTNLIQNACKFTPPGGEVRLEIDAAEPGFVRLCVADTGCGIQPEEVPHVFEKFYRGTSSHGESRGAGLGLAIAKHFMELQQGRIWVESAPGKGSRFYLTLPLAQRVNAESAEATAPHSPA
jgi:signal transduction histidine kinase